MSERTDFLYIELEEGTIKPVEFLRSGQFVDRHGQPVEVTAADLDVYLANFEAGVAGQEVPIDVNHKRADAAGWIKSIRRLGDKLAFLPDWNEVGKRLVGERIYRYVSATLDTANKVIKAISLVNFPAVKGLRPVELSEGACTLQVDPGLLGRIWVALVSAFDAEPTIEANEDKQLSAKEQKQMGENEASQVNEAQLREQIWAEYEAKMTADQESLAELTAKIRAEAEVEFKERFERRQGILEFAEQITGGEAGLSVKVEDVVEALEGLSDEDLERVTALLKAKIVDFSERGSSRDDTQGKKELPKEYKGLTREQLENSMVSELGDLSEYDLSHLGGEE